MNRPVGGVATPATFEPQQDTVPAARIAHAWTRPPVTAVNLPAGGVACPSEFEPQHAIVWSVKMTQLCTLPADSVATSASPVTATGVS